MVFPGGRSPSRKQLAEHEMYGVMMWQVDYLSPVKEHPHIDQRDWIDPRTGYNGYGIKIKKPWMKLVGRKPNKHWELIVLT